MRITTITCLFALFSMIGSQSQSGANQTSEASTDSGHPHGQYVVVNGSKLWVESEGSGDPLLLIAGGPGFSHSYFHPYLSVLATNHRVIYFDSFGRGKSDRAKDPKEYSFNRDVDDVEGLRKALGLKEINVLGHSYGGELAIGYALRYPQSVRKLILISAMFYPDMWQSADEIWNTLVKNQFPDVWDRLVAIRNRGALSCAKDYQDVAGQIPMGVTYFYNASAADDFTKHLEPNSLDVYCTLAGRDADVVIGGDMAKLDFRTQLANLQMPVLYLAGRFDREALPRFSAEFKRYAPQTRFIMFERSGHMPFVEEPDRTFQELRDFLTH